MKDKINLENIKIIRKYLDFLNKADGLHQSTINMRVAALAHFEQFINNKNFKVFNEKIAGDYKQYWEDYRKSDGEPLSMKTIHNKLNAVKDFFLWLYNQPGYHSHINLNHIKYLRLKNKTLTAIMTLGKYKKTPNINQVRLLINSIPIDNEIGRRDRALIAFTFLAGIRAKTLTTLKLGDVDLNEFTVELNSLDGTDTKFGKYNNVFILPYDDEMLKYVIEWIYELLNIKKFKISDPLFPMTKMENSPGSYCLNPSKVKPEFWKNTSAINKIFRDRADQAKLPYNTTHGFRRANYQHGRKYTNNMEELSALSQNISHSTIEVSESHYGNIDPKIRKEILSKMRFDKLPEEQKEELSSKVDKILALVEEQNKNS